MYSMVLMAALTTGTNAPDHFFRHGCHGCWGGCRGYWGGCHGCYGGYSCHGCWGGYGSWYGGCWGYGLGVPVIEENQKAKPKADEGEDMKEEESLAPTKAKLIVDLPADARLFIDNQPMKTPAGRRIFTTPNLNRGQTYYYVLRAEVVREGQTVTRTKRVIVRPGQEIRANFREMNGIEAANSR